MSHVLITLLGKPQKTDGHYEETTYLLNGQQINTSNIGLALDEHLQPDRLVFLGTAGSRWGSLLELYDLADANGDLWGDLGEGSDHDRVSQENLDQLGQALSEHLNKPVRCRLVPYLEQENDTPAFLRIIYDEVNEEERVSLDVTHGLRHLPMMMMLCAMYLRVARQATIQGIYYGAFDRRNDQGQAPVVRLDGMLHIMDWVQALNTFDKDGDYGVFQPLFEAEGMATADASLLAKAAFYERTTNPVQAAQNLRSFRSKQASHQSAVSELFAPMLEKRLEWCDRRERHHNERELALAYFRKRDYLRAALFGYEGYISTLVRDDPLSAHDYDARAEAEKSSSHPIEFRKLKNLRNALAHGLVTTDNSVRQMLKDEDSLSTGLKKLLKRLLG